MRGWGVFLIVVVLLAIIAGCGYIGFVLQCARDKLVTNHGDSYTHYRARRLGLPPPRLNPFSRNSRDATTTGYRAPAPAPGGIQGWISDKWDALRNKRTAGGAYENTGFGGSRGGTGRRGFGALDPDEAWDARVDNEASGYYEEQELGLQDPSHGPYGGGGYGDDGRGRSRSRQRELDDRYDEETRGGGSHLNPFGDTAETSNMSLRSVSPRPHEDTSYHGSKRPAGAHKKQQSSLGTTGSAENSPTERRSMFTEDV